MTGCSRAGCTATAVAQWVRQGTDAEVADFAARTVATRQVIADNQRVTATLNIAQLEASLATLEAREEGVTPGMLQLVRSQLADARDALAAIADPVPAALAPVMVSVFACAAHTVDDDAASKIHQSDCDVCACTDLVAMPTSVDAP